MNHKKNNLRRIAKQRLPMSRTQSAPSLLLQRQASFEQDSIKHASSDHVPSLQQSGTESNEYNSATSSKDDGSSTTYTSGSVDELDRLAQFTDDLDADPSTTFRGRRPSDTTSIPTQEVTPDDLARLIQFHSRAAIFEARTLNVQSRQAMLALLNERAEIMAKLLTDGVSGVGTNLTTLDQRLQVVNTLLPRVQELLAREDLLCQQYEATCNRLATAFEKYAQDGNEREALLITLVRALKVQQDKIKERLDAIDQRTVDINTHTHQTFGIVRFNLWTDRFMRNACSITTTVGVAALLLWCLFGGRQAADAIETNASLQKML
jgi:hypothetical protein